MKIIACGSMVPIEYETKIKDLSNAANRFLFNFCSELGKRIDLVSCSYIAVNVDEEIRKKILSNISRNHFVFKSEGKIKSVWKFHSLLKKETKKADYLMTYNIAYAWMFAPYIARLERKKSVLLLADYSPSEGYKSKIFRIYAAMQLYMIRKYDYVVGLSEYTKKYLQSNQKFICMEGGISKEFYDYFEYKSENFPYLGKNIIFMYSGLLSEVTGIDLLIQAFKGIPKNNCRLIISGKGEMEKYVRDAAEKEDNIDYVGLLPYDCYMEKLKEADIFVNPRNMFLLENANNFPSKVMEYIATGKPIISTEFPGNKRFEKNMVFCESTVEDLKDKMEQLLQFTKHEYELCYRRNRAFAREFLWEAQIDRFLELVKQ